jgi:hypothetical protein
MSDGPNYTFAVWYINDHGQIDYDLAETEEEAARFAAWADGDGTALGLQRADGSTVPIAKWPAFSDAKRRERERWQEQRNNPPPIPTRRAHDPFMGREIDIETAEPNWLGLA